MKNRSKNTKVVFAAIFVWRFKGYSFLCEASYGVHEQVFHQTSYDITKSNKSSRELVFLSKYSKYI